MFTIIFNQRAIECLKPFEASAVVFTYSDIGIINIRYVTCLERTPVHHSDVY